MFTLNCKGRLLTIDQPIVMGILNITPDSFYGDSRVDNNNILEKAGQMLKEGATILDIGGQSTRPGSEPVSEIEERQRVIPAIEAISKSFPEAVISIDTFYSVIAAEAVAAGASIVNDVSGGDMDSAMIGTVARLKVPFIAMHMKGTPQTMQQFAQYDNVTGEVLDHFIGKIDKCRNAGIHDIIIDPGFGFAKTIEQNFRLLKQLSVLKITGKPILVGLSRKGTIYKTLNTSAVEALNGTTVVHTMALLNGADILRVHDVQEAMEAIKLFAAYTKA